MKIIENPPHGWVRNLVEDCVVWLVKEQCEAVVVAPFEPPVGYHRTGRMFIRINGRIDYWFVSEDGKGINGSELMKPIEGSLPSTPAVLQSKEAEELKLEIARLRSKVDSISRLLNEFFGYYQ